MPRADVVWRQSELQAITDYAEDYISLFDLELRHLFVNRAIAQALGRQPADFRGQSLTEAGMPRELAGQITSLMQEVRTSGQSRQLEYEISLPRQGPRSMHTMLAPIKRADGAVQALISITRDVTESKRMTAALRASEDRLQQALDASDLGMWDWNVERGELYVDRNFSGFMGYAPGEPPSAISWMTQQVHPADSAGVLAAFVAHLKRQTEHCDVEFRARTRDGDWKWIHARGQVTQRSADGRALRMTGTMRDVHEQKQVQESLAEAKTRIQLLLEATDEGIIGLDAAGVVSFVNPAATRMLGYTADEMLGRELFELVQHVQDGGIEIPRQQTPVYRCLTERARFRSTDELFWRNGAQITPVEYSVSPIMTEDTQTGAVLIVHDVSEKRSMAHQLQFQALHDPLTGLINRRGFEVRLTEMLNSAKVEGREHALCYIDLDHFKLVNDTCGHAAGDELLRQLPKVLQPLVRTRDLIARLGGDEFAILLQDCSLERAAQIAGGVRDAVRAFRFIWQYRTFTIGASIGVVGITAESQGLVSVLGAADTACYVAKDQGPNHVHVSYPHDLAIIRRRGEMRWIARLKTALEENRFALHFQSISALQKPGAPAHHEILIRLLDNKGEVILPGAFIAAAERYQLMPSIDAWVIEHALRYIGTAIAPQHDLQHHRFGINLSGESLRDGSLLDTIRRTSAKYAVPPTMLYFEITETAAISNLGMALEFMRSLNQIGCQLALDDFGSGMSSFSYLKHLPIDYLKIDGSFVKDILTNPVDQAIVRAINSVGQQMGIATIAEYVENPAVAARLREIGVNYAQGFGVAMPAALEEFAARQRRVLKA